MKIISWNVNGIRAVEKKNGFEWLKDVDSDILCFQEVKAEKIQAEPFPETLSVYPYIYWNHSKIKKGYSGVAIFSKIEPLEVLYGIGVEEFDHEGRVIQAEYKDFVLLNIYFPNSGMDGRMKVKLDFNKAVSNRVSELLKNGKNIVLTGDYNVAHKEIDIARPKENDGAAGFTKEERDWMTSFLDLGMEDSFRKFHTEAERYSWWNMRFKARERNIGWRIDYFTINNGLSPKVSNADILDKVYGSDHAPTLLELNI